MQHPWTVWRADVDEKLCNRAGLNRVFLAQLRKRFWEDWLHLAPDVKRRLTEGGTVPRFDHINGILLVAMGRMGEWERWLRYLEYTDEDLEAMWRGEYPISPWLIRVYSALFGIKVDFLLLGTAPEVDKVGANVDVWPMTSVGAK